MSEENKTPDTTNATAVNIGGATLAPPATLAAKKPTAGRTVLYKPAKGAHQGLDHEVSYPATIVRVFTDTCVTLAVFSESAQFPLHTLHSVNYNADGASNTWRWPVLA